MQKILFEKRLGDGFSPEQRAVFHVALLRAGETTSATITELDHFSPEKMSGLWPIGGIEFVEKFLKLIGRPLPDPNPYPPALQSYLGRKVRKISRIEAQAIVDREPIFVKPATTYKTYTGSIFSPGDKLPLEDEKVWISSIVPFSSEVRVYVSGGHIAGISRYDDLSSEDLPDETVMIEAVSCFEKSGQAPAGYALDFGLSGRKTLLVELNDGWALGYYSPLDPFLYSVLLESRMKEILR